MPADSRPVFFYHLHYRPTDRPRPTKPPPTHSTIISISVHTVYTHTFFLSLSSQPFFFTVFPINLMQFDLFHGTHIIFVLVWFFFFIGFDASIKHFFVCFWNGVWAYSCAHLLAVKGNCHSGNSSSSTITIPCIINIIEYCMTVNSSNVMRFHFSLFFVQPTRPISPFFFSSAGFSHWLEKYWISNQFDIFIVRFYMAHWRHNGQFSIAKKNNEICYSVFFFFLALILAWRTATTIKCREKCIRNFVPHTIFISETSKEKK